MLFGKWETLLDLHFSKQWDDIIAQAQILRQEILRQESVRQEVLAKEERYDLPHNAYLNLMSFCGKDNNVYEAHRKFVDIHFVLQGSERIDMAFVSDIEAHKAYNVDDVYQEDRDLIFYTKKYEPHALVYLDDTSFLLLTPKDAHAPCLCGKLDKGKNLQTREKNLKAVIKIPIEWVKF